MQKENIITALFSTILTITFQSIFTVQCLSKMSFYLWQWWSWFWCLWHYPRRRWWTWTWPSSSRRCSCRCQRFFLRERGLSDGGGGGGRISNAARFYPSSGSGCVMCYGPELEEEDDVEVVQQHPDPFIWEQRPCRHTCVCRRGVEQQLQQQQQHQKVATITFKVFHITPDPINWYAWF